MTAKSFDNARIAFNKWEVSFDELVREYQSLKTNSSK